MVRWNNENLRHLLGLALLMVLLLGAFYFCYVIGKPFLNATLIALMLAVLFNPFHVRIQRTIESANLAATISTTVVFLMATIPIVILGFVVNDELRNIIALLREHSGTAGTNGEYLTHLREILIERLGRYIPVSQFNPRDVLLRWTEQASSFLLTFGAKVVANIFSFAFNCIVVFFSLFYFFREGDSMRQKFLAVLPLNSEQSERLTNRISETMVANLHGGLAVGLAQGVLTGLSLWVLGISAPILLALVTALASLVPVVGSALVWGPVALILALTGHWAKALILVVWGAAVVGQIDVVIRPYVIGNHVKIHSLLIFFALLGGVEAFGAIGIFLGPLILSITLALMDVLKTLDLTWQTGAAAPPQDPPDAK